ncbi:carboxypeptidase B-like [Adelges cooleyi]|uniref:carboxypeptidase B-like n=1 Tax=Adelges cooleyi TaxID=133065 RepID=UPI00218001D0|nr:carboxypeptidase B-like [Adelges cooleyi]
MSTGVSYEGYQVLRVKLANPEQIEIIEQLEMKGMVDRWLATRTFVDIMVTKQYGEFVKSQLQKKSLLFEVTIENVQKNIDAENPPIKKEKIGRNGLNFTFENYHNVEDVHAYIDNIAKEYPSTVEIITIGQSFEGTPLKVIRIKPEQNVTVARKIWVDGGTHAREWITISSVLYLVNELVFNRKSLEPHVKNVEFHILPLINPDGYTYSHETNRRWRKNRNDNGDNQGLFGCVGIDLNRNWPYHWGESGSNNFQCADDYRGLKAGSEPETRAIVQYIMNETSNFMGFISFHSYGQYILYPWGYSKDELFDQGELHRVGQAMASSIKKATTMEYTVGSAASLLYIAPGGFYDWAKGVAKIKYSYTIELRDTGKYGFDLPASEIVPVGKEAFAAVSTLAKEIHLS